MNKMAIIGDSTSVLGFKPIGIDAYVVEEPEKVQELWPTVLGADYALIIMTEPVFEAAASLVAQVEERATPAILPIPSPSGPTGAGRRYIRELMKRAIGADIKSKGD